MFIKQQLIDVDKFEFLFHEKFAKRDWCNISQNLVRWPRQRVFTVGTSSLFFWILYIVLLDCILSFHAASPPVLSSCLFLSKYCMAPHSSPPPHHRHRHHHCRKIDCLRPLWILSMGTLHNSLLSSSVIMLLNYFRLYQDTIDAFDWKRTTGYVIEWIIFSLTSTLIHFVREE